MEKKYFVIRKDNKLRLFYKGVELQNVLAWEARQPDFDDITFTVEGDFVEFNVDTDQFLEQTTEEFLVEQILQKDQIITDLKKDILGLRRDYGYHA